MGNHHPSVANAQQMRYGPVALLPSNVPVSETNVIYGQPGPRVGGIVINQPDSMTDINQFQQPKVVWDPDRHGYWVHETVAVPSAGVATPHIAAIHEITPHGPRLVDSIPEPEDEIIRVVKKKKKKKRIEESSDSSDSSDDECPKPVIYVPVPLPKGPTGFYPRSRIQPVTLETQMQSRAIGGCGAYSSCNGCVL